MPINQNTNQIQRANEHIRFLKKQFKNVVSIDLNLSDSFNHFKTELSKYCSSEISFVNSKSRLRMVSLYCIAQEKNVLVTGTGNKVEDFGIGFYTKYGDGGVDLSPIADLMKSQVKELAEFLNISKNIIEAPPTDGLWDNDKTVLVTITEHNKKSYNFKEDIIPIDWKLGYFQCGEAIGFKFRKKNEGKFLEKLAKEYKVK